MIRYLGLAHCKKAVANGKNAESDICRLLLEYPIDGSPYSKDLDEIIVYLPNKLSCEQLGFDILTLAAIDWNLPDLPVPTSRSPKTYVFVESF